MDDLGLAALGFASAALGGLGGLGGAVFLVPVLALLGVPPHDAAPLGLLAVAAGSLAAGGSQLAEGLTHHRLGIVTETAAAAGAVLGALVSVAVPPGGLLGLLAVTALVAALAGLTRRGMRNLPEPMFAMERAGEWPGTLAGAYRLPNGVVPYRARHVALGSVGMLLAGAFAGLVGTSGGFVKTPVMSEIMGVPVKVAAATTTFTVGVTASAALLVFIVQGRLDALAGAAIVAGSIPGGWAGAALQRRLSPVLARRSVALLLAAVGVVLLVRP
jgi:uncharacterized membrane protein YfcA